MRKAMFTIEVLVALFILFLVITISTTSNKFLNKVSLQQERYKEVYTAVLNIKETLSDQVCSDEETIQGTWNNVDYTIKCYKLKETQAFDKHYNFDQHTTNSGYTDFYLLELYRIKLNIPDYGYTTQYYITKSMKLVSQ